MDLEGCFLDPIPEDTSVVASSQHAVNLSTVSAVASSDSGGMVDPRVQTATKTQFGKRLLGKENRVLESTEGGAGIEDNVSDVNAQLCGANGIDGSSSRKGQLPKLDETPTSIFSSATCKKWFLFLAIIAVLAVAIVVGIYFIVLSKATVDEPPPSTQPPSIIVTYFTESPTSSPVYSTKSPTSSPVYSPEEVDILDAAIEKVHGTSKANMVNMNTPEGRGRDWMINSDGGISVDEEHRVQQRYILSVIHFATNGEFWTKRWLDPESSECEWPGVECNNTNSIVERIDISENNVTGTIPNEMAYLSNLVSLNVSYNNIMGTIPLSFFDFSKDLERLDMHKNQMTGKIPKKMYSDTNSTLRFLNLGYNQFTGMFPFFNNVESVRFEHNNLTSISSLYTTNSDFLEVVKGYHNQFSGPLPTIWNTNNLIQLDLGYNFWTGTIPQDLWDLKSLKSLILDHCNLTGPLPSYSESNSMHRLWLDSNFLSGTIPFEFGWNWTKLYSFKLQGNELNGTITEGQCNRWNHTDIKWSFETDCLIDCACCTNCSSATPANIDLRR